MREIKFRAWHKGQKEMFTLLYLTFSGRIGVWNHEETEIDFVSEYPYLELMQFTGLHDNNGNPIYEGDLLSIPFNVSIREEIHKVFYYQDGFVSSSILFNNDETASKNSLTWIIKRGGEVIGNIYENPELL